VIVWSLAGLALLLALALPGRPEDAVAADTA
jgi:hypothetical protein